MEELSADMAHNAPHWYIAYTLPRHEKAIAQRLDMETIPSYVPLYPEVRSWKTRRVQLDLPLFPCYVFAKIALESKRRLLSAPGVIRLLTVSGAAAIFPDHEMDALQTSLKKWKARPHPFHDRGKRIRLKCGPFAGFEGTIIRRNGKRKLIVTLDLIQSSILLDVDAAEAQLAI